MALSSLGSFMCGTWLWCFAQAEAIRLLEEVGALKDALQAAGDEQAELQHRLQQATERAESAAAAHQGEVRALQEEKAAVEAECREARESAEAANAALQARPPYPWKLSDPAQHPDTLYQPKKFA